MTEKVHEVRMGLVKGKIKVGCICRVKPSTTRNATDGSRLLDYMGQVHDLDESRKLYNNPENHYAPFTEGDKAKW
jgi:hypothetical protein